VAAPISLYRGRAILSSVRGEQEEIKKAKRINLMVIKK